MQRRLLVLYRSGERLVSLKLQQSAQRSQLPSGSGHRLPSAARFPLHCRGFSSHGVAAALARQAPLRGTLLFNLFKSHFHVAAAPAEQQAYGLRHKLAALYNGFTLSPKGQVVLACFIPASIYSQLFQSRCLAYQLPAPGAAVVELQRKPPPQRQHNFLIRKLQALVEEFCIAARAVYLLALFTPIICFAPAVFYFGYSRGRAAWMDLMCWTLERAGPAFIKWGQWASTRPDLFPVDLCDALEKLQAGAPSHSPAATRQIVEASFGRPLASLFDYFEELPVASGSIAQIHRARLSAAAAKACGYPVGTEVAVKVRHPGVHTTMHRDFTLMARAAMLCGQLPMLQELRLDESVRQFGGPLKEQLDLRKEAEYLLKFRKNFRLWKNVTFPRPLYPLVREGVLVETFEQGALISGYINDPSYKYSDKIAEIGMNAYLQMLLKDNWIHADLHPGNLMVTTVDPHRSFFGLSPLLSRWFDLQPKLVLLDVGMVAQLDKVDQKNIIGLFKALTRKDGEMVARSILKMADPFAETPADDNAAFIADMKSLFERLDPETIRAHTSDVLRDMIETIRQHHVTLKSTVSTVVVTTLVLEGWSSRLNPDLRILDTLRDMLAVDWKDRISRTVDKIMASGSLAVM